MTKRTGVPVSKRALIQRINRKLAAATARQSDKMEVLKTTRGGGWIKHNLGRHYTIDLRRNFVLRKNIDLEKFGRELDVLRPYEIVAE